MELAEKNKLFENNVALIYRFIKMTGYMYLFDSYEDMVQELKLRVWKKLDNYNDNYEISTYINYLCFTYCNTKIYKLKQKRIPQKNMFDSIDDEDKYIDIPSDNDAVLSYLSNPICGEFIKYIKNLKSEIDKKVCILYFIEDKKQTDISKMIAIPQSRISEKIKKIRTEFIKAYNS